ncbi:TolB family protein [Micromonospora chalcea]|uniref:TolB family protein n=1 Tax=Micromonospora chalcea TaxID=1874 RepID=UPI003816DD61
MKKIFSKLAACVALVAVGGCTPLVMGQPQVDDVAWVSQDRIYFLREVGSEGSELWLRDAGRERKLVSNAEIPDLCGPLNFLFVVKPGKLGLGAVCDGFGRLISYSETTGAFSTILDVSIQTAAVALADDGRSGYIGTGKDGCWEIQPFGESVGSYSTDWKEYSCRSGKSAKSPVVVGDGSIFFLATNEPRPERLDGYERRVWRLTTALKEQGGVEQVGPELHGFPDLAPVPGGSKAVVTVSREGSAEVLEVDLRTGQSRRIRQTDYVSSPSVSPDGKNVAFVDGKGRIAIEEISS